MPRKKQQPEPAKPPRKRKAKDPPRHLPAVIEAEFTEEPGQRRERPEPEPTEAKRKGFGWTYRDPRTIVIQPEWPLLLVEHMAGGLSFDSFAGRPDVLISRATLFNLLDSKRDDPRREEFTNAKEAGEVACLYWWEKQAQDGLFADTFKTPLWVYNMKCRFREQWHDRFEHLTDPAQLVAAAITQFHEMQVVMAGPEPTKTAQ